MNKRHLDTIAWYLVKNEETLPTPSVLVYPDRIRENIKRMIALAGHPDRLRPHVKTHKTAEMVRMQLDLGIRQFKCATLAEVEMVAASGGSNILLAYPLLGPSVQRFLETMDRYPGIRLAVTVDSEEGVHQLSQACTKAGKQAELFVDLDVGMHRTGIIPGKAMELVKQILSERTLSFSGLHLYDGHIHETDPEERRLHSERDYMDVQQLVDTLMTKGIDIGELACGGTPTFPIHARHHERTLCPGTPVLWDAGYGKSFPDLDFLPAAALAGRVISRPAGQLCIDLGYKAVASEMPHPRLQFLNLEGTDFLNHSEEHLVVASPPDWQGNIGQIIYAIPTHICPTMALHDRVWVVEDGQISGNWEVVARNRNFTS